MTTTAPQIVAARGERQGVIIQSQGSVTVFLGEQQLTASALQPATLSPPVPVSPACVRLRLCDRCIQLGDSHLHRDYLVLYQQTDLHITVLLQDDRRGHSGDPEVAQSYLLQPCVLGFGLLKDGDVGVGVFPELRNAWMALAIAAAPPSAPVLRIVGRSVWRLVARRSSDPLVACRAPDMRC